MKITRLTAAVLALLMLTACTDPGPNLPEQKHGEVKLSVTSGEEIIYPLEFRHWVTIWESRDSGSGWLNGEGYYDYDHTLEEYGDKIPTVTLYEVISVSKNLGFQFKISEKVPRASDQNIQWENDEDFTYERLSAEEPGVYYVMLTVYYRWDYVSEGDGYNRAEYAYYFKLRV